MSMESYSTESYSVVRGRRVVITKSRKVVITLAYMHMHM